MPMPISVTAVAAQYEIRYLDIEQNLRNAISHIESAAEQGADLVVLPELANIGYPRSTNERERQEYFDATFASAKAFTDELTNAAVKGGTTVVAGLACPSSTSSMLDNISAAFLPSGKVTNGSKTHLPIVEGHYFSKGSDLTLVDSPAGRLGLLICADASYPETARVLALRGADIICVSYMAPAFPNPELYSSLAVTRAFENQCYVVASHACGQQAGLELTPATTIAGPDGSVLARARSGQDLVMARLDRTSISESRVKIPRFESRRPRLYRDLFQAVASADSYLAQ
ncbi:carbon-nitrogen hydrolase family protein [Brevibacterium linens]|uniref:Carbon-nitrogen hydrolase n=1 Tax=Brevibacterium linens TaxID=1703 RepID=A0A2H1KNM4_BRELN|nr:carbon-nitrogen hydrolase family protein [Brevibacterium linens]SMY00822.1 Carbon-nitrogen hydrolase [Brevibacterium linens]